jgi:hypothetical protein
MIRLYADEVYWKDGGRHLVACFSPKRDYPRKVKELGPLVDIWSRKYRS